MRIYIMQYTSFDYLNTRIWPLPLRVFMFVQYIGLMDQIQDGG